MSAVVQPISELGTEYATRGGAARSSRAQLRLVAPLAPLQASRGVFVLLLAALLLAGLVGMLLINTSLAQGAFAIGELQRQAADLTQRQQALGEQIAAAAAPVALERRARDLGMVPNRLPVFLRMPDGKVLGEPRPAPLRSGDSTPTVAYPGARQQDARFSPTSRSGESDLWTEPILVTKPARQP
jgi:hypothetical protein